MIEFNFWLRGFAPQQPHTLKDAKVDPGQELGFKPLAHLKMYFHVASAFCL